jgi:hypothetical protein
VAHRIAVVAGAVSLALYAWLLIDRYGLGEDLGCRPPRKRWDEIVLWLVWAILLSLKIGN